MRILLRIFLALLAAGLGPAASAGDWEWTTSKPTGNDHRGVAWNGTQYIAVGRLGTVVRSANGASWSRVPGSAIPAAIHKTLDLNGVAANGAVAVAVGEDGKIMRSANGGASWSLVASFSPAAPTADFHSVAYGSANTFVAVGGTGVDTMIFRSQDNGSSWTRVSFPGTITRLSAVAWNGARFAAVGDSGAILVSTDGTGGAWGSASIPGLTPHLLTIAGGGNRFVVGGLPHNAEGTIILFNGSTWTRITRPGPTPIQPMPLEGAAIQGNTAVLVGEYAPGGANAIVHRFDVSSPTPMVTTNTMSGIGQQALGAVSKGTNQFVVVGENGSLSSSADGTSWSYVQQNQGQKQIRAIARGGNNYIAVASRELLHSANGESWTRRVGPAGGAPEQLSMDMHGAAYGRGKFVVVGGHSMGAPIISAATGGGTWTREFQASNFLPTLSAVAYAPEFDVFVAVGKTTTTTAVPPIHRTVFVSRTGSTWEAQDTTIEALNTSGAHLHGIAWNATNDVFVAVGTTGSQAIAIAGQVTMGPGGPQIAWTQRGTLNSVLSNQIPKGIAWSATSNLFVVAAPGGITVRNPGNGSGWTANTTTPGSFDLNAIAWNASKNEFLVAGDQASVWTLVPPATSWTRVITGAQGDPSGDVFHAALWDGRAYHVGGSDTVVSTQSDTMSKILRIDPDVIFEHDFELP